MEQSPEEPSENIVEKRFLKVKVLKGVNIRKKRFFYTRSSSYVKLSICGKDENPHNASRSYKSQVVEKDSNPLWNLDLMSEVDPNEDEIIVEVFIKNKLFADQCLGSINFHLGNMKIATDVPGSIRSTVLFKLHKPEFKRSKTNRSIYLCLAYSNHPSSTEDNQKEMEPEFDYELLKPENGSEPLPPGWFMSRTPDGKIFFLNQDLKITTWKDPRLKEEEDVLGPLPEFWEEFVHEDGNIFYVDHLNKRTQWDDPRLAKFDGPEVLYSVTFKKKYENFIGSLGVVAGLFRLKVSREHIFRDSYKRIANKCGVDLMQKPIVKFVTEIGLDGGGMAREWFCMLSKQMFNPQYGLFEYSSNYTIQICPSSALATESHLSLFNFIGKFCAMAIYHRKLIEVTFTQVFYKMMLGEKITLEDIKHDDAEYYQSLRWILDNDPELLDLTFCATEDTMGNKVDKPLKPHGDEIKLTNENKKEYVNLMFKWKFVNRVKEQMDSIKKGFSEVISCSMLKMFSPYELKIILSGLPQINVADWKANTKYKGTYHQDHPIILRFWKVVFLFSKEQRSSLLRFVTGTPRAPMNGFAELSFNVDGHPFTIEDWGDCSLLPLARTCINRLYLPPYPSYQEMRSKICCAIGNSDCFDGVD